MDLKEDIRSRLPIDQLVSQYCPLKKKGRNFVCVCPFHSDKNPSFVVSPDKGIGYCFACQSGGDIFSFFQKIENVDFPTALKMLADKVGLRTSDYDLKESKGPTKDEKERIRECLVVAKKFFQEKLQSVPLAHSYVLKRGVTPELLEKFELGYAPDSFSETYDYLLRQGFSRSDIVAAGLGVQKELSEEKIYDRFRHRIMFPIMDAQGLIIGFGGRTMGDSDAKYVNSPESALYKKSSVLYGFHHAKDAVRKLRRVVLVEGYFDTIAAHKAGISHVVAVSGTALTQEHVQIIKRFADDVILCLDQDNAGHLAASRAFELLSRAELNILSVKLPAKDPDEIVQKDPSLFRSIIEDTPLPYLDTVLASLSSMEDVLEPSGKSKISTILFPLFDALPSSVELRAYLEKSAHAFGMVQGDLMADYQRWRSKSLDKSQSVTQDSTGSLYNRHELCLGIAMLYPGIRQLLSELIEHDDSRIEKLRKALLQAKNDDSLTAILSSQDIDSAYRERIQVLALYCEETFANWSQSLAEREMKKLAHSANREIMVRKQFEIVQALKSARSAGRVDEETKLIHRYQQLLKLSKMSEKDVL